MISNLITLPFKRCIAIRASRANQRCKTHNFGQCLRLAFRYRAECGEDITLSTLLPGLSSLAQDIGRSPAIMSVSSRHQPAFHVESIIAPVTPSDDFFDHLRRTASEAPCCKADNVTSTGSRSLCKVSTFCLQLLSKQWVLKPVKIYAR